MTDSTAVVKYLAGGLKLADDIAKVIAPVLEKKVRERLQQAQAEALRKVKAFFTEPIRLKKLKFKKSPYATRNRRKPLPRSYTYKRSLTATVKRTGRQRGYRRRPYRSYRTSRSLRRARRRYPLGAALKKYWY